MNRIMFYLPVLVLIFFMAGCTKTPVSDQKISFFEFPETLQRTPAPLEGPYNLLNPRDLAYMDGKLFIRESKSDYPLRVYDIHAQTYDTVHLSKGRGPRQISGMMYLKTYGGQIHVMDVVTSTLYDFDLQQDLTVDIHKTGFDAVMAGDFQKHGTNLYYLAAFEDGRIGKYNTQSRKNAVLGQTPEGIDDFVYNYVHDGYLVLSPDGQKIAIAQIYTDLLEIYDTSGTRLAHAQGPLQVPVKYKTVNGRNVRFSAENHHGYLGVCATENQIIGFYSGTSFKNPSSFITAIHVMGWDGAPQKRYELETPLLCATLGPNSSTVYGITVGDELQIVQYSL